jgi:hypothetical protein
MVVGQESSGEVMSEDEDGRRLVDNWGGEQRSAVRHIGLVAWRLWHRSEQRTINRAEQHTSRSCFSLQAASATCTTCMEDNNRSDTAYSIDNITTHISVRQQFRAHATSPISLEPAEQAQDDLTSFLTP